jgi:putative spermidine/putrescine transport system permease protein
MTRLVNAAVLFKKIRWLLPLAVIYTVFLVFGLVRIIIESFGSIPALGLHEISAAAYADILSSTGFVKEVVFSLTLACAAALIATGIGVLLAHAVVTSFSRFVSYFAKTVFGFGLVLPYLYMAFLATLLLGRTGIISRLLFAAGFISDPLQFPQLMYSGSGTGIVIVFILKGIPFVALFVAGVMSGITQTYADVAATLGAGRFTVFRKVYLPLSSNAIVWSSTILFGYFFGSFEIPYLLAANITTLSVRLYSLYIDPHIAAIPRSMAMNVLFFIIGILGAVCYSQVLKRGIKWQSIR